MKKLRVLSLFAGIGGFDLGLESTGCFETVAVCEIDEHCRSVLAKRFPTARQFDDVSSLSGKDVGSVEVICGGFPCQDISTSGTQHGLDGERSGLWKHFARLIGEIRPKYVIVENSPNLLVGGNGSWMGRVVGDLARCGYDCEWHVLPASAVGAPHNRKRLWIIAYAAGVRQPGQGRLLNAVHPAPDAYREASGLVDAFQGNALPFVCGRHDGVSAKLAEVELKALGNAVVPQTPELIGRAILKSMEAA